MLVHVPVMLPVSSLRACGYDLKKKMGTDAKAGLRASLDEFGFSSSLNVAANKDGTYAVLDGNSRLDEVKASGVPEVPCVVHEDMEEGFFDWENRRKSFVLAYDANRKGLDKKAAISVITDMISAGADGSSLARLSGIKGIDKLVTDTKEAAEKAKETLSAPPPALDSLVLMGPADQVRQIREYLDSIRGTLTHCEVVRDTLRDIAGFDLTAEAFLTIFLDSLARHAKGVAS
jgi:hypothetical protein